MFPTYYKGKLSSPQYLYKKGEGSALSVIFALLQKDQIIGLHQPINKDIAKTTKSGLKFVKCMFKTWKGSGEPSSYFKEEMRFEKKSLE